MLGHIEKYHHGQYADVGRLWLIAPTKTRKPLPKVMFLLPIICPNCESTDFKVIDHSCQQCISCGITMVPDQ